MDNNKYEEEYANKWQTKDINIDLKKDFMY